MFYKLPPKEDSALNVGLDSPMGYERQVTIPVNEEMVETCQVGDKCHVTLSGTIVETFNRDSERSSDQNLILRVLTVEVTQDDMKLAEEQFSSAFDQRAKRY